MILCLPFQVAKSILQQKHAQDVAHEASCGTAPLETTKARLNEEVWAEEGIEQLAGKGWEAMEAERQAESMRQISARVRESLQGTKVTVSLLL